MIRKKKNNFQNQQLLKHLNSTDFAPTIDLQSETWTVSTEAALQSVFGVFVWAVIPSYSKKQLLSATEDCYSEQNSWEGRGSGASDSEWNKDDASDTR